MKKIFTLIAMCMIGMAANAAITIYVKAQKAPNIWAWNASGNIFSTPWPGVTMSEKKTVNDVEFWYYTFDESIKDVSILFNDGAASDAKQTKDFKGITTDRYFEYDGVTTATDISDQYITIPDAEVTDVVLRGNFTKWGDGDALPFTAVEAGKSYKLELNLTGVTVEENVAQFKIVVNGSLWIGFDQVELNAPNYVVKAIKDNNFEIDLTGMTEPKFNFSAVWGGGKAADENWTVTITGPTTAGIESITTVKAQKGYNLAGQRINANFHGIAIMNGKKVVLK